jgi:murein DD-endopeptidase MepM/ murein hydrolase activator NlpD
MSFNILKLNGETAFLQRFRTRKNVTRMNKIKKYLLELIIVLIALVIIFSTPYTQKKTDLVDPELIVDSISEIPVLFAWGLPIDSSIIDTSVVRFGQSLSDILRPRGVSAQTVDKIASNSKDIFDVRRIKAGKPYFLISSDSFSTPNFLVYEDDQINYIVFDLDSSLVHKSEKKVDTILQMAGGTIETSLWNAMVKNNASPVLAVHLSDIFAWTIDFFGIQANDEFKVIYDAHFVDGNYVGIGHIHAAKFVHLGTPISAYFYKNNEQEGYFDDNGNSLRKAFLKAPLNFSRISSRFSHNRLHPVLKIRRPHRGVDYAAPSGTPVYSIGDGVVVKRGYQSNGGGNYLNIKHNSVYTSQYMHLRGFASGITQGVRVKQGQLIGYVGSTGLSSGPHLDFRIFKNGTLVDPLKVEAPPVEPISEENFDDFKILKDSLKQKLDQINTSNESGLVLSNE